VMSSSASGAGRSRLSPNIGEMRYSLVLNFRERKVPEYRIGEDMQFVSDLYISARLSQPGYRQRSPERIY
jgi:hypothetical protein